MVGKAHILQWKKSPLKLKMISNSILIQIVSLEIRLFVENSLQQGYSSTILCSHYVTFSNGTLIFFDLREKIINERSYFLIYMDVQFSESQKTKHFYGKYSR